MRRSFLVAGLLAAFGISATFAQQAERSRQAGPGTKKRADVDPELWRVLQTWSAKSSGIERLKGKIVQRTYDFTFSVERLGSGEFWFESPDKGRLDLAPIAITNQRVKARAARGAKVMRDKKTGKPFELQTEDEQSWVCDGQRVTSIHSQDKSAMVLTLPPGERGRNIMNGPLPFLFALPPDQAIKRFRLKLLKPPTQRDSIATLQAEPLQVKDSRAWSEAKVMLDTRTGLPVHVQLTKPDGNTTVTYSFLDLTVNSRVDEFLENVGRTPFKPSIPRGFTVKVMDGDADAREGQPVVMPQKPPAGPILPNLIGLSHEEAEKELVRLGVAKENIAKFPGKPAVRDADIFKVRQQKPLPGTPITLAIRVSLQLWTR